MFYNWPIKSSKDFPRNHALGTRLAFSRIWTWIRRDNPYLSLFSPNVGKCSRITPNTDTFYTCYLCVKITCMCLGISKVIAAIIVPTGTWWQNLQSSASSFPMNDILHNERYSPQWTSSFPMLHKFYCFLSLNQFVIFNPWKVLWSWIAFSQNSFVISPGLLYHLIRRNNGWLANEVFTSNPIVSWNSSLAV